MEQELNSAIPWLELRIVAPLDAQDAVSAYLWELGVQGITEEAATRNGEPWCLLRAYVESADSERIRQEVLEHIHALDEFFPGAAHARVSVSIVEQQDWNAKWKEHFKPFHVSPRLVIRPVWEAYSPQPGDVVLDLDPGMAFGTGAHESTRGCLNAIDALLGGGTLGVEPLPLGGTVLDVGTGSGILLLAALKLGASRAVGIDLDPVAITAATENVALNGLEAQVELSDTLLEHLPTTQYPLVLANILAPTLMALSADLVARLAPGGALVLSGLLNDQADSVRSAFLPRGLKESVAIQEGEWTTLVLRAAEA